MGMFNWTGVDGVDPRPYATAIRYLLSNVLGWNILYLIYIEGRTRIEYFGGSGCCFSYSSLLWYSFIHRIAIAGGGCCCWLAPQQHFHQQPPPLLTFLTQQQRRLLLNSRWQRTWPTTTAASADFKYTTTAAAVVVVGLTCLLIAWLLLWTVPECVRHLVQQFYPHRSHRFSLQTWRRGWCCCCCCFSPARPGPVCGQFRGTDTDRHWHLSPLTHSALLCNIFTIFTWWR